MLCSSVTQCFCNSKWSHTRAMGLLLDVIGVVMSFTKGVGLPHNLCCVLISQGNSEVENLKLRKFTVLLFPIRLLSNFHAKSPACAPLRQDSQEAQSFRSSYVPCFLSLFFFFSFISSLFAV